MLGEIYKSPKSTKMRCVRLRYQECIEQPVMLQMALWHYHVTVAFCLCTAALKTVSTSDSAPLLVNSTTTKRLHHNRGITLKWRCVGGCSMTSLLFLFIFSAFSFPLSFSASTLVSLSACICARLSISKQTLRKKRTIAQELTLISPH